MLLLERITQAISAAAIFAALFMLAACSSGAPDAKPTPTPLPGLEQRLSWPEQLSLIQSKVSAEDPNAVLEHIYAKMVFDPKQATDRSDPAIPFPITEVTFEFLEANGETVSLLYFDVMPDRLINSKHRRLPSENTVESKVELAQLPTMVRVGPLEACLSTLEVAQLVLDAKATEMDCGAHLTPYGVWSDEFQVPAVWSTIWTSYQRNKEPHSVGILLNAETGERLKMMQNGVEIKPES